jgi:hypothetical protein
VRASHLAVIGVALGARAAFAEPVKNVELDYAATPGCPDRSAFIGMVAKRTDLAKFDAAPPDVRLSVALEANGSSAVGHLRVTSPERTAARTIDGSSCEEVASALALITALAVDPSPRALETDAPPAPPEPPKPVVSIEPPAPPPPPRPEPPSWTPPPIAKAPPPGTTVDFALGGAFALDVGPAPRPLVGGAVSLELRWLGRVAWSLRTSGVFEIAPAFDFESTTASFSLLRGRVDGCVYRFHPVQAFALWPCVLGEAGAVESSVVRLEPPNRSDKTTPWGALGFFARAELIPASGVTIELSIGPSFPLSPAQYLFGEAQIGKASPIELATTLGLVLRP